MGQDVSVILDRQSEVSPMGRGEYLCMGVAWEPTLGCLGADQGVHLVGCGRPNVVALDLGWV
jgi:hypothetical protein